MSQLMGVRRRRQGIAKKPPVGFALGQIAELLRKEGQRGGGRAIPARLAATLFGVRFVSLHSIVRSESRPCPIE